MDDPSPSDVTAAPAPAPDVPDASLRVARYQALHARRGECGQRAWISGLVLVPAAFASLAGLTRITCPAAMDFIILSGVSTVLLGMWMLLAEHFRRQEEAVLAEIAALDGVPREPANLGSARFGRLLVALAVLALFVTAWNIRPPCETEAPVEDPELTRRL